MKVNKKIVDMEIKKLVNMSRLLTEDKIKERIIRVIITSVKQSNLLS